MTYTNKLDISMSDDPHRIEDFEFEDEGVEDEDDSGKTVACMDCVSGTVYRHPRVVLCLSIIIPLLLGGLIIPVCDCEPELDIDYTEYEVDGDIISEQFNAISGMRETSQYKDRVVPTFEDRRLEAVEEEGWQHGFNRFLQSTRERKSLTNTVYIDLIFLHRKQRNLLDCEHLNEIRAMERLLFENGNHQDWCWLSRDGDGNTCQPIDSAVNYFFPSVDNTSQPIVDVHWKGEGRCANVQEISQWLFDEGLVGFFDRDFGSSTDMSGSSSVSQVFESTLLKARMKYGLPLEGYSSTGDRRTQQINNIRSQIVDMIEVLDGIGSADITLVFSGPGVYDEIFLRYLQEDLYLAIGSLAFITVYIIFHTKSLTLGFAGIMSIFMSFPVTLFLYIAVLGNEKIGVLNTVSLWVILGIGCDDVFVFYDTWRLVGNARNKEERVKIVFRKAGFAMAFTTVTTGTAFLGNCASRIGPVRDFGLFMGSLVLVNYVLVMTLFASVVVLYTPAVGRNAAQAGNTPTAANSLGRTREGRPRNRRMLEFFKFVYHNMYSLTIVSLVFLAVSISYIPQLELADETIETLPSEAKIEQFKNAEKYYVATCQDCTYRYNEPSTAFSNERARELFAQNEDPPVVENSDVQTGKSSDHNTGYVICFVFGCMFTYVAIFLVTLGYSTFIGKTITICWVFNINPLSLRPEMRRGVACRVWSVAFLIAIAGLSMIGVSVDSVKSSQSDNTENEIREWVQLGFGVFFLLLSVWTGLVGKATYDQIPLNIYLGNIQPLQLTPTKQKSTGFRLLLLSFSSALLGIILVSTSRASDTEESSAWDVEDDTSEETTQELELAFGTIFLLSSFVLFLVGYVSFYERPLIFLKIYQVNPLDCALPKKWMMMAVSLAFFIAGVALLVNSDEDNNDEDDVFHNSTLFSFGLIFLVGSVLLAMSAITNGRGKPWKFGSLAEILPLSESRGSKTVWTMFLTVLCLLSLMTGTIMVVYGTGAEATSTDNRPSKDPAHASELAFGIIFIFIAFVLMLWAFYSGGAKHIISVGMQESLTFWKKNHLIIKAIVSVAFLVSGIVLILAADDELNQKVLESNPDAMNENLGAQYYPIIYLAWGAIANPDSEGDYDLDEQFDLSDPDVQVALAQSCDELFESDIVATANVPFRCIPSEFRNWVPEVYGEASGITWPVPKEDFNEIFYRWTKSNRDFGGARFRDFYQLDESGNVLWLITYMYGRFDNELPYTQLRSHYSDWEDTIENFNVAAPMGGNMGFQACEEWVRMRVEEEFVRGMYWAVSITLIVSVLSTAIFLRNFTLCCTVAVLMVSLLTCIMATLAMMRVEVSVVEALALSIILGLSIDYAMHLTHAYLLSKASSRVKKVRDALLERGGSVLSGAVTTMGACFILFFGKLQIFPAFARIFLITILYSMYFALVVLMLMLLFWGPHGGAANNMNMDIVDPASAKERREIQLVDAKNHKSPLYDGETVKENDIELELSSRDRDDLKEIVNMFDDSDGSTYLGVISQSDMPRRSV